MTRTLLTQNFNPYFLQKAGPLTGVWAAQKQYTVWFLLMDLSRRGPLTGVRKKFGTYCWTFKIYDDLFTIDFKNSSHSNLQPLSCLYMCNK